MSNQRSPRPKRRFDGLRERVLDAAWELLIERGLADFTLAEVGRRVETSAGHLLYHFGSKDELLLELLRRNESELWEKWRLIRAAGAGFDESFRAFCAQFLPGGVGDPRWLVWMELWPRGLRVEELCTSFNELDEAWRTELAGLLEEAGVVDSLALAQRICWMLDGIAVAITLGETGATPALAIEHAVAMLPESVR